MRRSILVVFILAMMTVALAPSASAITVDPLTLQAVKPKVIKKPKPEVKLTPKVVVSGIPAPLEYVVVSGDTLSKVAADHQTTVQRLWQKNTNLTNPDILNIGDKLIIPTASEILADRPMLAPAATPPSSANRPVVPGNAYAPGNCTEYVKNRRPDIGNFWGDASQWGYSARSAGYTVNSTPSVGSIGVALAYGHVVYVEGVNGNGTVNISEQNYEGFGIVSSRTAPIGEFEYIH
jgi:LysM repeat protein